MTGTIIFDTIIVGYSNFLLYPHRSRKKFQTPEVKELKRVALSLILLCSFIFTLSCGRLVYINGISCTDFFSGIKCDIPLENVYSFAPYTSLHTNDSIEELKRRLEESSKEMGSFSVETLTGNSLLIEFFENEKSALFIVKEFTIQYQETEYQYHYWFSDLSTYLYTSAETKEACDIGIMHGIPLPQHLLGEEIDNSIQENLEVPIIGGIDEFEAFYELFHRVYPDSPIELERSEGKLTLRNVPVRYHYFVDADGIRSYDSKQIDQITITFSENSNHEPVIILSCKAE